mgnify:CR=1 FL=1
MRRRLEKHCKRLGSPAFVWGALLALWICFIWGHSMVQGPASSSESGFVYELLMPVFDHFSIYERDVCTFVIRKAAHFSEYLVLGVIAVNFAKALRRQGVAAPSLQAAIPGACALVPVLDETLQLFVPGRSGSPRDVAIDLCGLAVGTCLATVVVRYRRKA